jgi:pyruvate dehydrogenase E2 component (dihydrolipoamide acetyltransferase)
MATDVIMPALGVAQENGTLLNWLKAEGQSVTKGEALMEVETDKATVEIEAPASGILTNVTASAGDEIPVGNKIAVILAPGETATPAALQDPHPRIASGAGSGPHPNSFDKLRTGSLPEGEGKSEMPSEAPVPTGEGSGEDRSAVRRRILSSPAAKRIAREKGIDLASLKGSGPGGSVLAEDVLKSTSIPTTAAGEPPGIKQTVQLTPMRRIVGERMATSKRTAPHFYVSMDADMTEVTRSRNAWKEKGEQIIPSINDFILGACARALKDFPSLNAAFTEQGVRIYADINIGMAVALEEGLVVPVIRNADRLSLHELAKQSRELAEKAQKKKLFPLDYDGGTFTVSNLGMFGVDNFVAIINPPQCAILAVGQVSPRVVPHGEGIAVRPIMTMSLSADHRVVDGAIAARFLREVKRLLENPVL